MGSDHSNVICSYQPFILIVNASGKTAAQYLNAQPKSSGFRRPIFRQPPQRISKTISHVRKILYLILEKRPNLKLVEVGFHLFFYKGPQYQHSQGRFYERQDTTKYA